MASLSLFFSSEAIQIGTVKKKRKEKIAPPSDPSAAEFSCSGCCPDLTESAECDHKEMSALELREKKTREVKKLLKAPTRSPTALRQRGRGNH